MKHAKIHKRFRRSSAHRSAMFANLAVSLVQHEQVYTTLAKAKALRPYLEKMLTIARNNNNCLAARRRLISQIKSEQAVRKIFSVLSLRYKNRNGGYLRIIKAGFRAGDAAPVAIIEFVDKDIAKGKVS